MLYITAIMDIIIRMIRPGTEIYVENFGDLPRYYKYIMGLGYTLVMALFGAMVFLTVQRFFAVWYHLRYETSWIYRKRTHFVIGSWVMAGLMFIVISVIDLMQGSKSDMWIQFIFRISGFGLQIPPNDNKTQAKDHSMRIEKQNSSHLLSYVFHFSFLGLFQC